jgi:predicted DNA binding CopG/RHH family protein
MKITMTKQKVTKPMQPFNTLKEEAYFWDTHDVVDGIDEGTVVGFHKANKTKTLTIRFDEKDLQTLRVEAFNKGIGPTTLARMWLKERISAR